jgi:tetratricopeptide (TPR) repeat protein
MSCHQWKSSWLLTLVAFLFLTGSISRAQTGSEGAAASAPVPPPSPSATAEQLEQRGDELRDQKRYLDAGEYYEEALKRLPPKMAMLHNKVGISNLHLGRLPEAKKAFERAIKTDKSFAEAYNNLGVVHYMQKHYGSAVKQYKKALRLRDASASFHSNLASAYFSQKKYEQAAVEYQRAFELDPNIFETRSRTGIAARMSSPEDHAAFSFVLARMYAKNGQIDRALQYLRRAIEEGYKAIGSVYEEQEFAELRKDPRFAELMASKPPALP